MHPHHALFRPRLLGIVLSGVLAVSLAGWQGGSAEAADPVDTVTTIDAPEAAELGDTILVTANVAPLDGIQVPDGQVVFDAAPTEPALWDSHQGLDVLFAQISLVDGEAVAELDLDILTFLTPGSEGFWLSARYVPGQVSADEFNTSLSEPLWVELSGEVSEPVPTTTTVMGPLSAVVGEETELTALVSPDDAEGTVEFTVNEVPVGDPVDVEEGWASLSYTFASAGLSTVRAEFTPTNSEAYDESEDMTGVDVTVTEPEPGWPSLVATTTVVTGPASATTEAPATLAASVSPASAAGTVQFSVDGSPVGSPVPVDAGAASMAHTFESGGVTTVGATFTPENPFAYAGSAGSAVLTVSTEPTTATTTTVTGLESTVIDLPTSYTATVTPATATGTVAFSVNGASVGEPVAVAAGAASLEHTFSNMGLTRVRATFTPADPAAYDASTAFLDVMVDPGGTAIEVTGPDTATVGEEATLTATVQPADATGTVTFLADGDEVATVDLDAGMAAATHTFATAGESSVVATFEPAEGSADGPATSPAHPVTVDQGTTAETEETPVSYPRIRMWITSGCDSGKAVSPAPLATDAATRTGPNGFVWIGGGVPPGTPTFHNIFTFTPTSLIPGFLTPRFGWFTTIKISVCIAGINVCIGCRAQDTLVKVTGTVQCLATETGYACPFDLPAFKGIDISADVPLPAAFGGQPVNVESTLTSTDPVTGETTTLKSQDDLFQVPERTVLTAKLAPVKSDLTSVRRGKSVAYRVQVNNAGVVTANGVRTCVSLGKGAKVLVAKGADVQKRHACWTLPSLKREQSVTRTLTLAAPPDKGPLKIVANVTPKKAQADPVRLVAMLNVR